jgi:maltooligosyltrehalose synthase
MDNGKPYPPAGSFWDDTVIEIPAALESPAYVNLLTGEVLRWTSPTDRWRLPVSDLFAHFPVALLCNHPADIHVSSEGC